MAAPPALESYQHDIFHTDPEYDATAAQILQLNRWCSGRAVR
jgi:hypothetical protein